MVKIETFEQEPTVKENEIKVEDVSNNSKRKSSEGEESNENPSSNKKIKMTEEDLEQMKGMTPEQKKYVEGLLGKIDEYDFYLNAIIDKIEEKERIKKELLETVQNINNTLQKPNLEN